MADKREPTVEEKLLMKAEYEVGRRIIEALRSLPFESSFIVMMQVLLSLAAGKGITDPKEFMSVFSNGFMEYWEVANMSEAIRQLQVFSPILQKGKLPPELEEQIVNILRSRIKR